MDILTFISKLVSALAWPSLLFGILVYFRKELPGIIRSLRRVKVRDVEMEFGEAVMELAAETRRAVPAPTNRPNSTESIHDGDFARLMTIAELSPRAGIVEAWLLVEVAAAKALSTLGVSSTKAHAPLRLQERLRDAGVLTPPQEIAFEHLRRIRNDALHLADVGLSSSAVLSYIDSAIAMATYLNDVALMN